jgi:transcriptional regulator with XRE-family HTH domain
MKDIKLTIAKNISYLRQQAKLTQLELAQKIKYSDKSISKWERGESLPDIETLAKLAQIFDVQINAFLEELERQQIEIYGETAFICNDGAVLFIPNERGAVDITLVRNPVKIDYNLGITDREVRIWKETEELTKEIMAELGGTE